MSGDRAAERVLVAGIGNVFLGDDGFGVEVVNRIDRAGLPDGVDVADYGIRGVHLAYELLDGRHATLIMVDAVPTGETPGTVSVLEVPNEDAPAHGQGIDVFETATVDAHGLHPEAVLDVLRGLGGHVDKVLVIGCEPASIEERMGLSDVVAASVDEAVRLTTGLAREEAERLATGVRSGVA
jgi:hydrogenase maturation protease